MGTVLDHVRDSNALGYRLLQAEKYKPLVHLFGAMNYDANNQQMVALGDHFSSAMTGFLSINDSFAMPLANALRNDEGLQSRIATLAADQQGIALLDNALTEIQGGGDVENAINTQYSKRFGQQQLAKTNPPSTDPKKRPQNTSSPPVNTPGSGGGPESGFTLPPEIAGSLGGYFQGFIQFLTTFFERSGLADLLSKFSGSNSANTNHVAGPSSAEQANANFRSFALGYSADDTEIAKTKTTLQKDGKTPAIDYQKQANGNLYDLTLHMPDGNTEHWRQTGRYVDQNTGRTMVSYDRMSDDGKTLYVDPKTGKPQAFVGSGTVGNTASKESSQQDADAVHKILRGQDAPDLNPVVRQQLQQWTQDEKVRMDQAHLPMPTTLNMAAFDSSNATGGAPPAPQTNVSQATPSSNIPTTPSGKVSGNLAILRQIPDFNRPAAVEATPAPQQASVDTQLTFRIPAFNPSSLTDGNSAGIGKGSKTAAAPPSLFALHN